MSLSKNLGEVVEYRGIEGLVAAEVLKDNNNSGEGEGYVTGEVFSIAGIAELSKSTESSNESKYYDNMPALVISSTGADEVTCTVSAIDQEVLAKITGQQYDAATGTLIEGERNILLLVIKLKKPMVMKFMYGDTKEHSIFQRLPMRQKMMEQMQMVKKLHLQELIQHINLLKQMVVQKQSMLI